MGTTHSTILYGDTVAIKNMLSDVNAPRTALAYESSQCAALRDAIGAARRADATATAVRTAPGEWVQEDQEVHDAVEFVIELICELELELAEEAATALQERMERMERPRRR